MSADCVCSPCHVCSPGHVCSPHMQIFFKAVNENDLDKVDEILQSKKIIADARNTAGKNETALHIAAYKGHEKLAQLLVDKYQADVNAVNDHGEIPLQIAKDNYHAKLCRFLIDRNSKLAEYARGLLNCEDVDRLFEAVAANDITKVSELIDTRAADVNSVDKGGYNRTVLHVAALNGYEELSRVLVDKYKANINHMDDIGDRPIHVAAQNDRIGIAKFLAERGSKDVEDVKDYFI